MKGDVCKVGGCCKYVICEDGLACGSCKMIKQRTGSYPCIFEPKLTTKQRFYASVLLPNENGCMLWAKGTTRKGYALIRIQSENGRKIAAHRYSYALHYGLFDKNLHVCHKCDIPSCMAPDHLFLGTNADNVRDKVSKGRQASGSLLICSGETNPGAKLTDKDVLQIRALLREGVMVKSIAEKFKVGRKTISDIKVNRRWAHIKESKND